MVLESWESIQGSRCRSMIGPPPLRDPGSNSTRMIGPPRSNHPKVPWTPPWKNGPPFESKFAYYPWPHGPRSPSQSYLETEYKVFTLFKPEHR